MKKIILLILVSLSCFLLKAQMFEGTWTFKATTNFFKADEHKHNFKPDEVVTFKKDGEFFYEVSRGKIINKWKLMIDFMPQTVENYTYYTFTTDKDKVFTLAINSEKDQSMLQISFNDIKKSSAIIQRWYYGTYLD